MFCICNGRDDMLKLENVIVGYNHQPILHNDGLTVQTGQVVGIKGGNGTGKSTLLKSIVGILPLIGGTLCIKGRKINPCLDQMLKKYGVAYIPQFGRNISRLSVEQNIFLATGLNWDDIGKRINAQQKPFFAKIQSQRGSLAGNLSGGQNLHLSLLIITLLMKSEGLLILDEPSAGADQASVGELERILQDAVSAFNMAVLMVEQNRHLLDAVSDATWEAQIDGVGKAEYELVKT